MISRDIKIIQNDTMQAEEVRAIPFGKHAATLREWDILRIGFQVFRSLHLRWGSKAWHLGLWIVSGSLQARHRGGELGVKANEILIAPAEELREVRMDSEAMTYYYVHFRTTERWAHLENDGVIKLASRNMQRMSALQPLLEEDITGHRPDRYRTGTHLMRAFCDYLTEDITQQPDPRLLQIQNRFSDLWKRVYGQPAFVWTADIMAEEAYFSKGHFHRSCKRMYGIGPMAMVTKIRLEQGAGLLLHSDETIDAIAERVGFGSARAFSAAFLREYGVRPGRYRKQMG